jgi:uridine phosphorylase
MGQFIQQSSPLQPMHMNAAKADILDGLRIIEHSRRHNLYLGSINVAGHKVDVAVMSSGMGCPSVDIIVSELLHLGVRRLIRVGTAGSLQPSWLRVGSLVIPTAAVRDESTSRHYLDPSIPVLASLEFLDAVRRAAVEQQLTARVFLGPAHTKDSLYAREFGEGPLQPQNAQYMQHLRDAGVLASEMECAQLFTLTQVWNQKLSGLQPHGPYVRSGAILAFIGDDQPFADDQLVDATIESAVQLGFATIAAWVRGEDAEWR